MRILFIGAVRFSESSLRATLEAGGNVIGVIGSADPDRNSDYADLEPLTHSRSIPFFKTSDVNGGACLAWMRNLNPDVIFCFGWSRLLKSEVLSLPQRGVIGYHPAALPRNRGRHPLIWALVLGLPETASTFFFMGEGADTGDLLSQESIAIAYEDDAETLYAKIEKLAAAQIKTFLPDLIQGRERRFPQEASLANSWRKRGPNDGRIDFRMSSRAIYNLVRAMTRPYPGAHVETGSRAIKVWKVAERACDLWHLEPGRVLSVSGSQVTVKTGDGAVELLEHEWDPIPRAGDYL